MADEIAIDKALFQDRLNNFVTKWKADKRGGDQIFQGAGSIATVVGKASEPGTYLKPAAYQVRMRIHHVEGPALTRHCAALAARLRISRDSLHPHPGSPPDCHNQEEG